MPDIKEQIKQANEAYNKFASILAEHYFQKIPQFQLNEFISLLNGKKVLDAGCGPGRDTQYFLDESLEPIGIDRSPNMLLEAKTRVPKGNFKQMELTELQFLENDFDGIWAMSSLSALEDEDVKTTLRQFYKILKQEGILFLAVREGQGQEIKTDPKCENNLRYYNLFTKEKITQFLEQAGFKIIKIDKEEGQDAPRVWLSIFSQKINN